MSQNQKIIERPNGFDTTAVVRVTTDIEQTKYRGPFTIGEEFIVTKSNYSNGSVHTMTVYTPKGKLYWKEYEIVSGEMPLPPNQPDMSNINRSTQPPNAQQIRMDRAARIYGKRVHSGHTVQY